MLGNKNIFWNSQNWLSKQPSAQAPLKKGTFDASGQNLRKSRYQSFPDLSDFAWYFDNYLLNILIRIACRKAFLVQSQLVPVSFKLQHFNIVYNFKAFLKPLKQIQSKQVKENIQIKQSSLITILHAWIKLKIDIRRLPTFADEGFIDRFFFFFFWFFFCYCCCFQPK